MVGYYHHIFYIQRISRLWPMFQLDCNEHSTQGGFRGQTTRWELWFFSAVSHNEDRSLTVSHCNLSFEYLRRQRLGFSTVATKPSYTSHTSHTRIVIVNTKVWSHSIRHSHVHRWFRASYYFSSSYLDDVRTAWFYRIRHQHLDFTTGYVKNNIENITDSRKSSGNQHEVNVAEWLRQKRIYIFTSCHTI